MTDVNLPDGTVAKFPDSMSGEEIQAVLQKQFGGKEAPREAFGESLGRIGNAVYENVVGRGVVDTPGEKLGEYVRGGGAALARGIADVPATLGNLYGVARDVGNKIAPPQPGYEPLISKAVDVLPKSSDTRGLLSSVTGGESDYRAPGNAGDFIATAGEFAGNAGLMGGPKLIPQAIGSGLGSEAGGKATEGSALEPYARIIGGLLGGIGTDVIKRGTLRSKFGNKTDTVKKLQDDAGKLYNDARQNGVVANSTLTGGMSQKANTLMRAQGVVTPKGRFNPEFASLKHAVDTLDDYSGSAMTPTEMLTTRKVIQAAVMSKNPNEARVARLLMKEFDTATSPLAPQIAKANGIFAKAAQGELIEETIELAKSRANQYATGMDHALRTEFRSLHRQILKGQLRASPDEAAIIKRIVEGGSLENNLSRVGKYAPTGVLSAGVSGGVPFGVGMAASGGNPVVGGIAAGTVLTGGTLARTGANAVQNNNAAFLSAIARNGGKAAPGLMPSASPGILSTAGPGLLADPNAIPGILAGAK